MIVKDRAIMKLIKDYKQNRPMEQLLESRRIREELRDYEHNLWQF